MDLWCRTAKTGKEWTSVLDIYRGKEYFEGYGEWQTPHSSKVIIQKYGIVKPGLGLESRQRVTISIKQKTWKTVIVKLLINRLELL